MVRSSFRRAAAAGSVAAVLIAVGTAVPAGGQDDSTSPAALGSFSKPFAEPTVGGRRTADACVTGADGKKDCKPAGSTVNVLATGKLLYWNALEGTENVQANIVAEFGRVAVNDQSRVLDLKGPTWTQPGLVDGGANPSGYDKDLLVPGLTGDDRTGEGALFCSDQNFLADGRVIATGGTAYYYDPGYKDVPAGVTELEGLRNTRIFDPRTSTWRQSGDTHIGRWYPTMVTLGDGREFIASGVQKLIKPVYGDRPEGSGSNVKQTETYDPATGRWADNGAAAQRSLPLFPRLHLLPDGHVYYNVGGQAFNPAGQSYDEALWNVAASYDPATKAWSDLGVPGLPQNADLTKTLQQSLPTDLPKAAGVPGAGPGVALPGFRGSTFSVMLPLNPDASGNYTRARFLTAGGVLNPSSPGSYVTTSDSLITTVDTTGGKDQLSVDPTGDLPEPRWYPTGVSLPTGEVMAFSGADRDGVVAPGTEIPNKRAVLFDPATNQWRPVAEAQQPRTYHNTAVLLPDGRVLVGGHAIISTLYAKNQTLVPGVTAPYEGRDPSFEIYSPPYLFRGARPAIARAPGAIQYGSRPLTIAVDGDASRIESVTLVRNPSLTHLVDGDQRTVELRVLSRAGDTLTVAPPPDGNVAPPGPYMLFVNARGEGGLVPSVSRQVFVGRDCLPAAGALGAGDLRLGEAQGAVARPSEARTARAEGFCVSGGGQVVAVYHRARIALLATTSRGYRAASLRPGARAPKRAGARVARRVYRRGTSVYATRRGRIAWVARADRALARSPARLRSALSAAGIRVAR